jgi:hypothetical protein
MPTPCSEDLRRRLGTLFAKNESVRDFRPWFSKAWWEAESSVPEDLYDVASDIGHHTYILDSGLWDERSFIHKLQQTAESCHSRRSAA